MRWVVAALAILVAPLARAEGPPATTPSIRVVVADSDPELRHAIETSLAPWQPEIVFEPEPPKGTADAEIQAHEREARFVVWRSGGDLVVFDRERGSAEHRDGPPGSLDATSAAAAALTVKTLMRLPPPQDTTIITPPVVPVEGGMELRVQTGLAGRIAHGSTTDLGARVAGAVLLKPWAQRALRFGITGELGTATSVQIAAFKGTYQDWSLLAIASYTRPTAGIELEPYLAAGLAHSAFDGTEMMVTRSESATFAAIHVGVVARWRVGAFTFGPTVELAASPGTPTYTKKQGNGALFSVPTFAFSIGGLAAVDFGR